MRLVNALILSIRFIARFVKGFLAGFGTPK
jgi:hypothetical protein